MLLGMRHGICREDKDSRARRIVRLTRRSCGDAAAEYPSYC